MGYLLFGLSARSAIEASRPQAKAAVFSEHLPGMDETLARELADQVRAAGYSTESIGTTILTNQLLLTARQYDLLVLPGVRSWPLPNHASSSCKFWMASWGRFLTVCALDRRRCE